MKQFKDVVAPRLLAMLTAGALLVMAGCEKTTGVNHLAAMTPEVPSAPAPQAVPFLTPIVELRGSPEEIGAAHARLLGDSIRTLHTQYLNAFLGSGARKFIALAAAQSYENQLLPEHRTELQALAKGLKIDGTEVDDRELMLAQCFLDMMPSLQGCSTVTLPGSAAPDHIARFGRNLDFPSFDVADKYTTVFIYHPESRYTFAAVGWPGLIGVLSGMNERGLALANMEVPRSQRLPGAMPYIMLYRTVLEQCRNVDEAVALLEKTPRQSANNLMLMDAAGNRAVVEITPEAIAVRRAPEGQALLSTNHQRGNDLDSPGFCRRYDILHKETQRDFGQINVKLLENMLGDASQGDFTLQSMIFEPSTRTLYLAAGANAAHGTFSPLDLKPYFAKR